MKSRQVSEYRNNLPRQGDSVTMVGAMWWQRHFFSYFLCPSNTLHFSFSFSLPSRNSDPGLLSRLFSPLPNYDTRLHFYRDSTPALSSLVDSHRIHVELMSVASEMVPN